jgi:hypothetical protein
LYFIVYIFFTDANTEELQSQMANQQYHQNQPNTLHLTSIQKERVFDFLTQQQKGLSRLTEIVRKDFRDLDIMRNRSIMEIKQQNGRYN